MKRFNNSAHCNPKYPTMGSEDAYDPAMQMNPSKSTKQPNQWLAGALVVFSLLGSIHPHYMSHANRRYHANILYSRQIQKSNDDFWYTPPRSPAFDDLLGS
jgi:hypothetical protein